MNFVEGLPQSHSVNCIFVVVDKFTKYAHFVALKHPYSAASLAKLFIDNIYELHGLPLSIISDRDRVFTSTLWRELFKLAKVNLATLGSYWSFPFLGSLRPFPSSLWAFSY